jgi:hypothetical protein
VAQCVNGLVAYLEAALDAGELDHQTVWGAERLAQS